MATSGGNNWYAGGGHLTAGVGSGGTGGYAYGLTNDQVTTNPAMGGGGVGYWANVVVTSSSGGGIIIVWVDDNTSYTGQLVSRSTVGAYDFTNGACGSVVAYTSSIVDFDIDVTNFNVAGSNGRSAIEAPAVTNTSHYVLSHRVDSDRYEAEEGSLPAFAMVRNWINSIGAAIPVAGFHDPTSALPVSPSAGDRWIASETGTGWTDGYIYEYDGSDWLETEPGTGVTAWSIADASN
jgi:hypothetical protein